MGNDNLKPFPKGQSGNPAGRPKGVRNVATVLAELLEKVSPESVADAKFVKEFIKKRRVTNADALAARLLFEAIVKGSPKATAEINKLLGCYAPTKLEHEGGFELIIRDETSQTD